MSGFRTPIPSYLMSGISRRASGRLTWSGAVCRWRKACGGEGGGCQRGRRRNASVCPQVQAPPSVSFSIHHRLALLTVCPLGQAESINHGGRRGTADIGPALPGQASREGRDGGSDVDVHGRYERSFGFPRFRTSQRHTPPTLLSP